VRVQFVPGRLASLKAHDLAGCHAVCHIAAAATGCAAALFTTNVLGTRSLVEASAAAGVPRFVLISSIAVYGTAQLPRGATVDETCPLDPRPHERDPYTYSKVAQEQVAWEAHVARRIGLVVVRPGVIYGPGRDPLSARVGLQFGRVVFRMGGHQALPYVHVDACAAAIALATNLPDIAGEAFNLTDAGLITGRELIRQYRRQCSGLRVVPIPQWAIGPLARANAWYTKWSKGQLPAVLTPYKCMSFWKPLRYSSQKARTRLGWTWLGSTHEGLRETEYFTHDR